MYEYDDDEPLPTEPQPSLLGRLCWFMILLTFLSGIMCNVVVLVALCDKLIRGINHP